MVSTFLTFIPAIFFAKSHICLYLWAWFVAWSLIWLTWYLKFRVPAPNPLYQQYKNYPNLPQPRKMARSLSALLTFLFHATALTLLLFSSIADPRHRRRLQQNLWLRCRPQRNTLQHEIHHKFPTQSLISTPPKPGDGYCTIHCDEGGDIPICENNWYCGVFDDSYRLEAGLLYIAPGLAQTIELNSILCTTYDGLLRAPVANNHKSIQILP